MTSHDARTLAKRLANELAKGAETDTQTAAIRLRNLLEHDQPSLDRLWRAFDQIVRGVLKT